MLGSATAANAAVPLPQVEGPIPVTNTSHPFSGAAWQTTPIDLEEYGYVEEEYYISGNANVYEAIPHSDYETRVLRSGDYTTRILVRRPINMKKAFSGDVAVEIMNMTAQFDVPFDWGAMWEKIVADGDVWVGVTGKPNVIPALQSFDAERYAEMSFDNPLPPEEQTCGTFPGAPSYNPNSSRLYENGLAYDMFSQLGALVRSNSEDNPLFGAGHERHKREKVRNVFLIGESQSAFYLVRYYKWITPRAVLPSGKPVFDGYLGQDAINFGRSLGVDLNQCDPNLAADDPQRHMPARRQPFVGESSEGIYPRNPEFPTNVNTPNGKRWFWVLTGVSHENQWMFDVDPRAEDIEAAVPEFAFPHVDCGPEKPEPGFDMVEPALYEHLKRWAEDGRQAPPAAPDLVVDENGDYVRDADGNVLGGLRLPELQVPAATYIGGFLLSRENNCLDNIIPFSQSRLDELYSSHNDYVRKYRKATNDLVKEGFVLRMTAKEMIERAEGRPIP